MVGWRCPPGPAQSKRPWIYYVHSSETRRKTPKTAFLPNTTQAAPILNLGLGDLFLHNNNAPPPPVQLFRGMFLAWLTRHFNPVGVDATVESAQRAPHSLFLLN